MFLNEDLLKIIIVVLMIIFGLFPTGIFVNESVAVEAMRTHGFTNVEVVDTSLFFVSLRGCSNSDSVRFTVKATNSRGQDVTCYVCSGWLFKGSTVRTR